jgi:hypothetical protein
MSATSAARTELVNPRVPREELRDELRHIRDLVFLRDLLRERGAAPAELREYEAAIGAARAQLATAAKRESRRYAAAA